jgi:FkbM family methyltransferase
MEKVTSFRFRHWLISRLNDIDIRGVRRIAYNLPRLLLPIPEGELVIRTLYGIHMKINPRQDVGVETSIYNTGTYEKGTLQIIKENLKEGDVFVDVGANIGLMSLFASQLVKDSGKIHAFEPHPVTRQILQENIEMNNAENIYVSPYAAGSKRGRSRIFDGEDQNRGSATLSPEGQISKGYDVEVISLDEFFRDQKINMIKMDVEGYEPEVLKGAEKILKRDHPPFLIVECSQLRENSVGSTATLLFDFIKSVNKYRIYKSRKGKERVSRLIEVLKPSDMPLHDNVYCLV